MAATKQITKECPGRGERDAKRSSLHWLGGDFTFERSSQHTIITKQIY